MGASANFGPIALLIVAWAGPSLAAPPHYDRWQTFDASNGLPSDKVLCVYAGGTTRRDVWVGTDRGLALWREGRWRTFTQEHGLAHRAVLCIAEDPDTGDIWIGTMGGLSRYSAGRFDTFDQLSSGLANDVVYGVAVRNGEAWAATAAGTSRYQIAQNRWIIYDETNAPMHEIWCYAVTGTADRVYLAVWGGGLLEYDLANDRWKHYRDPDGEMEIDLFKDDGLGHDVATSVACDDAGRVWVGSYFGLSSYDGRNWRNYMDHDSPLAGNFIPSLCAHGAYCWIATDSGLSASDRDNWWTYRRDPVTGHGMVAWKSAEGEAETFSTPTIFPHNYILGVSFQGDDLWVATEKGVARGTLSTVAQTQSKPPADEPPMTRSRSDASPGMRGGRMSCPMSSHLERRAEPRRQRRRGHR